MAHFIPFSLAAGAVMWALGVLWLQPLAMALRSWRFLRRALPRESDYLPTVALIAPCRGIDQGFETNVRAVLAQDYPAYQVIFVTGSTDDPAYRVLARVVPRHSHARLLVAGQARDGHRRGQRLRRLLGVRLPVPGDRPRRRPQYLDGRRSSSVTGDWPWQPRSCSWSSRWCWSPTWPRLLPGG